MKLFIQHCSVDIKKELLTILFIALLSFIFACSSNDENEVQPSIIETQIIAPSVAKLMTDITISAAGTTSTGKYTLLYDWKIIDEPEVSSGSIKNPNAKAAKLFAITEGVYRIELVVSDGTATDSAVKDILIDLDGDGIPSENDTDKDGDGILNQDDAFPENVTEYIDSNNDGIGNYSQTDEDDDGINDINDEYPFDSDKSTITVFNEQEFNGNLYPDGNTISEIYPFKVAGKIESTVSYPIDIDYFLFNAFGGDLISIVLRFSSNEFEPTLSLLDNLGATITTAKTNNLGKGTFSISARIPQDGEYSFTVSDLNNNSSSEYTYIIDVFKDSDMDGLSDSKEIANGMIPYNPDSDGDGLCDGYEFFMAENDFDIDSDNLPVWWDNDSDNDGIEDKI